MIRGDITFLFLFLISHCATLIILCYVKSRIYFILLVFSTHAVRLNLINHFVGFISC